MQVYFYFLLTKRSQIQPLLSTLEFNTVLVKYMVSLRENSAPSMSNEK